MKNKKINSCLFLISFALQFAAQSSYDLNTATPIITGPNNTAFGEQALTATSSGDHNTGLGKEALFTNTNGNHNTACGDASLFWNVAGSFNTAIGKYSLYDNVDDNNTACGFESMEFNTNGFDNTAVGAYVLRFNIIGNGVTAMGVEACYNNQTGNNISAFGTLGLFANGSSDNTSIGAHAAFQHAGGVDVTAVGYNALGNLIFGDHPTALGANSYLSTEGLRNTCLGSYSDLSGSPIVNATAVGYGAVVNASNRIWLGDAAVTQVWSAGTYNTSDRRFKSKIVEEDVKGLSFIMLLRPVVYNFEAKKLAEFLTKNMLDTIQRKHLESDFRPATEIRQSGFIAQEVEKAAELSGYNFSGINIPMNENDTYGLSYPAFVVPLVKAVQEQQILIEGIEESLNNSDSLYRNIQGNMVLGRFRMVTKNQETYESYKAVIKYNLPKDCATAQLLLYNIDGKQIKKITLDCTSNAFVPEVSDELPTGTYLFSIIADKKFVVNGEPITLR